MPSCAMISDTGIEYYQFIDEGYDSSQFNQFMNDAITRNVFDSDTVLVLDNALSHHTIPFFIVDEILPKVVYLPAYSPQLNSIENSFAKISSDLDSIRLCAMTRTVLHSNIVSVMDNIESDDLSNYHRRMWSTVDEYINNQRE